MIKRTGLTRIDLVVAVACVVFVLANVPVIVAGGRGRAKLEVCMANLRALTAAWSMYADDNEDKIVNGAAPFSASTECKAVAPTTGFNANELPWVGNCVSYWTGGLLPEACQIAAIKEGALWPYLKDIGLYKCPTGYREAMLTYSIVDSMNGYGSGRSAASQARIVKVRTQIRNASDRIVFVDEGFATPDSYAVYYDTNPDTWWDSPMVRHSDGATFGFADGHSEYWKWKGKETVEIAKRQDRMHTGNEPARTPDGKRDLYRVQKAVWGKLGYPPTVPP
jgi:prepilin-type processing-associated H-X9-DG protein